MHKIHISRKYKYAKIYTHFRCDMYVFRLILTETLARFLFIQLSLFYSFILGLKYMSTIEKGLQNSNLEEKGDHREG